MAIRNGGSSSTKRLTVCAMFAALSVVMLYLGSLVELLDISMAVIASLLCVVAVIEYGKGAPWMIYGATAILSLVLLPNKTPAVLYAMFFGYYPILKEKFEKLPGVISWVLKEITFNLALIIMGVATVLIMLGVDNALVNPITVGIAVVLAEVVFVLYDIAMTRLISFYLINLRRRFRF